VDDDVMISIDPHKMSNTAAVLDPATKTGVARQRFAHTMAGYRQLRTFSDQWRQRRWAVEGCRGAGGARWLRRSMMTLVCQGARAPRTGGDCVVPPDRAFG
jgi:hypothetical protein